MPYGGRRIGLCGGSVVRVRRRSGAMAIDGGVRDEGRRGGRCEAPFDAWKVLWRRVVSAGGMGILCRARDVHYAAVRPRSKRAIGDLRRTVAIRDARAA